MTRKAARGRRTSVRARTTTARGQSRTTTRTGRKTASARASKSTPSTQTTKRTTTQTAPRPSQPNDPQTMREPLPAAQHEDDEDMDWLAEDEDPRSQIVEDDDEWEPQGDDEW
jgi:hypothetical protein